MDNEITTKLLLFSVISFLTEKLNILYSDMIKCTSVLHRARGRIPVTLSLVLGLVGYSNDHFMLERTKFNKLELNCKEE